MHNLACLTENIALMMNLSNIDDDAAGPIPCRPVDGDRLLVGIETDIGGQGDREAKRNLAAETVDHGASHTKPRVVVDLRPPSSRPSSRRRPRRGHFRQRLELHVFVIG